jgi:uncharacterized membrane protein
MLAARGAMHKSTTAAASLAGACLAYVVARAANVPFTYDESYSYFHFVGAPLRTVLFFRGDVTENNHSLNSLLMTLSAHVAGNSELALRLPNVVAFVGYAAAVLYLVRRLQHTASGILGAVLLLMNPFVLEIFSLARGYGLALCFVLGSMAALAAAMDPGSGERLALRRLTLATALACASAVGNLAFLDYVLPFTFVALVVRVKLLRRASSPS